MLDALYLQIFRSVEEDEIGKVIEVLGVLIHIKDTDDKIDNLAELETFFHYCTGELTSIMADVLGLVQVRSEQFQPIKIYHASLPNFLHDPSRSNGFFSDPSTIHLKLADHCLEGNGPSRRLRSPPSTKTRNPDPGVLVESILGTSDTERLSKFLLEFT